MPGDSRHLQHLIDPVRAPDHDETSPLVAHTLVGHDQRPQARRVDERKSSQVDDERPCLGRPVRGQQPLEPIDARHVEFARQAQQPQASAVGDIDLENLGGVLAFRGLHPIAGAGFEPATFGL